MAPFEQILLAVGSAAACVAAMVSIFNYFRRPQMPDVLTPASAARLLRGETDIVRAAVDKSGRSLREELGQSFGILRDGIDGQVRGFGERLNEGVKAIDDRAAAITIKLNEDLAQMRTEASAGRETLRALIETKLDSSIVRQTEESKILREELGGNFQRLGSVSESLTEASGVQKERLSAEIAQRPPQPADDGHEHTVVVRSIDQASGDVLRVESGFQGLNRDSTTKCQNPASRSNIGLSEEALVRLEAAVRGQKEKERLSPPSRLIAAAEIGPSDSDARQEPDKIALPPPPARFGFCAQDTTLRLPPTIRLQPVPELSLADNESGVETPDTFNSELPPQAAPERLEALESPPPVESDVDEYLRRLALSGERGVKPQRLPRAAQLLPVTGLPPVREARADEALINGFRVPPSLVPEHPRAPAPMRQRRGNLITLGSLSRAQLRF